MDYMLFLQELIFDYIHVHVCSVMGQLKIICTIYTSHTLYHMITSE